MTSAPGADHRAPRGAWGLVVGPSTFIAAWAVGDRLMPDHSGARDAISSIAAVGSPQQLLMTVGFVVYGAAVLTGAWSIRGSVVHRVWPVLAVNALATWGVAALPLGVSSSVDLAHGAAAAVGYASLAAAPAVAAGSLAGAGHGGAARASAALGLVVAVILALTTVVEAHGALQRVGLTLGDLWLMAAGAALAGGRLTLGSGGGPDRP